MNNIKFKTHPFEKNLRVTDTIEFSHFLFGRFFLEFLLLNLSFLISIIYYYYYYLSNIIIIIMISQKLPPNNFPNCATTSHARVFHKCITHWGGGNHMFPHANYTFHMQGVRYNNRFERCNPVKLLVTTFDNSNTYWSCHFMHIK